MGALNRISALLSAPRGRMVALVLLCLALWLPGLASLPPFDRDESRFAQASKQMVQTHDFVSIYFQDVPRNKKPVGIYWLQSASAMATGAVDQIWAYRLPSLLGGILAVLLTAAMGARLFTARVGLLAGVILATTLLMGVESRMAKTDAMLLASICALLYPLVCLFKDGTLSTARALLFWGALAVGVLIKGPLPLLALLGPLGYMVWQKGWASLKDLRPLVGLPLFFALVLPWFIAITLKTDGAFWTESVGKDLLAKATSGQESHGAPPGYYLLTFFITFWPWAPLMVPALWRVWQNRRALPAAALLAAWIVPFWLVFELIPTKLLHYTLPTFPALALLLAWFVLESRQDADDRRPSKVERGALWAAFGLSVVVMAAVPTLAVSQGAPILVLITSGLTIAFLVTAKFLPSAKRPVAVAFAAGAYLVFYITSFGVSLPEMTQPWLSREAAQLVAPYRATCQGPVASIGYTEPSLVFLLGTDTKLLATENDLPPPSPDQPCQLVLWAQKPTESLPMRGEVLGKITGFNYSRGKPLELVLTRLRQE